MGFANRFTHRCTKQLVKAREESVSVASCGFGSVGQASRYAQLPCAIARGRFGKGTHEGKVARMKVRTRPTFMIPLLVAAVVMMFGSFGTAVADEPGGTAGSANGIMAGVVDAQNAEAQINVASVSAAPGAAATVNISVANNPGIMGMVLKVDYDEALTLTGAEAGEAFEKLVLTKPGKFVPGCRFAWDGQELSAGDIKDGTILSLTFTLPDNAENGAAYPISVSCIGPIDSDLNPVDVTVTNGQISVL